MDKAPTSEAKMTPTSCNGMSVIVSDMAVSMDFYRACGLAAPSDVTDAPHAEIEVQPTFRLMFDTVETIRSFEPDWQPPAGGHRVAIALECASSKEVDERYRAVTEAGFTGHLEPFDAAWGQRYAVLHDPDGIPVDLYAGL